MNYEVGCLVKSLAGHDKSQYFIILQEDKEYVTLSDGKLRGQLKPKRKKKKHVQLIKQKVIMQFPVTDEEICYNITQYVRSHNGN